MTSNIDSASRRAALELRLKIEGGRGVIGAIGSLPFRRSGISGGRFPAVGLAPASALR